MISSANTGVISVSCTDLTYPGLHIHMDPPANILNSPTKPQIKQPHIQQSPKIGAKLRQHFQGFYAGQSKSSDQNLSATTPTSPSIKAKISKSFNDWTSSERLKLWRSKLPKGKKPSSSQQLTEVDGVVPILPLPNFPPTPLLSTAGTSADRTSLQPGKSQRLTTAAVENTYDSANGSFLPAELSVVGCGEKTIERNPLDTSFSQDSLKSEFVRYSNGSASDVELSRFRSQPHFASLKHPRTGSTQMSYRTEPSESGSFGYPDSCYSELRQINQRSNEKRNSLASFYQQELAKKVFLQQQLKPNGYKTSKSYGNLYNDDKIYEEIDFAPDINSSLVSNIPPPVKIAPLSGIRPETDSNVIRPIAFRPIPAPGGTIAYTARPAFAETFTDPSEPSQTSPVASASPKTPSRYTSFNAEIRSNQRLNNPAISGSMDGPNPVVRKGAPPYDPQKFTGYWDNVSRTQSFPNSPNKSPGATKRVLKPPTFGTSNGEYDLIPPITGPPPARNSGLPHPPAYAIEPADLIGKSPALPQRFLGAKDPTRIPSQQPQQHHQNGGGGDIYCPAGSQSSRNSSGIQVTTPSPSDSGHAGDIEAVLKERENEILQLRSTMEHNEKVIVRVYQEKEERWYEKIKQWASRLETALKTEQKLSEEVQQLRDERLQLQHQVDNLTDDRICLQTKVKELEKNYSELKRQLELQSQSSMCSSCGEPIYANAASFLADKADEILLDKRLMSETPKSQRLSKSPTPTDSLRSEVGSLREEISGLRSSLLEQMSAFHDEKSRWEQEKLKVVDYQKLLQENYVEMFRRNKSLEQQLMQLTEEVDRTSNKSSQSPALSLSRMSCNSDTVPTAIPSLQQQLQSNDNSSIKSDSPSIKPPTS